MSGEQVFGKSVRRIAAIILLLMLSLAPELPSEVALATDDHLLLCEAVLTPTAAEFIEIANPSGAAVSLDNYYLSDDEDYALLPGNANPVGSSDFVAQFPAEATIPPNGVIVVAFDGAGFASTFGFQADFEIHSKDSGTPDMIATDVSGNASLTDDGENAVLFFWDGVSDLVADVDMVNLGTPSADNDIGNKTGVSVDGPDSGTIESTYLTDAVTMPQQGGDPGSGTSTKRIALEGTHEISSGGNGITGDDETTENILVTWDTTFTAPNPGVCAVVQEPTAITLASFTTEAGPAGVAIRWETGTEIDNAGFNLYRTTAADGPYIKINDALIPAKGNAVSGASYVYLDTDAADENTIYYYKLEDIDYHGVSTFHGPVDTAPGVSGGPAPENRIYLPLILR